MKRKAHPMQPVEYDKHNVIRFKANQIVRDILDWAQARGFGLNEISSAHLHGKYTVGDMEQFNQLIGYSVSGYGDLSFVRPKTIDKADARARKLIELHEHPKAEDQKCPGCRRTRRKLVQQGDSWGLQYGKCSNCDPQGVTHRDRHA